MLGATSAAPFLSFPRPKSHDTAAAQLSLAKAQSDKADTDLADTVLRAPNDGVILTRAREPGAIVQSGDTVVTLTIDRPMRVRAYVDESDLGRISPGMAVEVTTDSNAKTSTAPSVISPPQPNSRRKRCRRGICAPTWSIACASSSTIRTTVCGRASQSPSASPQAGSAPVRC